MKMFQITILVKDPNAPCARPTCAEPSGQGDGSGGSGAPAVSAPKVPAKAAGGAVSAPAASGNATAAASPASPAKAAAPAASSAPAKAASSAPKSAKGGRKRRDAPIEEHPNAAGTMDISSRLSILDIEDQVNNWVHSFFLVSFWNLIGSSFAL
jgi:hypothetical protein